MNYGILGMVDVDIWSTRTFQDVVLLVDREDFKRDITVLRLKKLFGREISENNITALREKYKYPESFQETVKSAVLTNKILDFDTRNYKNDFIHKGALRDYASNPILSLRLDKEIRLHRSWYIYQKKSWFSEKVGYRKLSKQSSKNPIDNVPVTTIQTAVGKYKEKLQIKL